MKESRDNIRSFLKLSQSAEDCRAHFVARFGQRRQRLTNLAIDMCPRQFIGIELRRIRRQVRQFDLVAIRFHELVRYLRFMGRMRIDNQKDLAVHSLDQPFEKIPEYRLIDTPFDRDEAKVVPGIDGRDHIHGMPGPGGLHDWRTALGTRVAPAWLSL